jgi:DNA-binding NarL/FixJ family response regulator
MTIRVLVADDQDIVRAGLTMILDAQPGIDVVGEAADGREAVALARTLRFADTRAGPRPAQPIEPLTSREEEIPIPVARGWTNSEIADDLHISISTVKTHLASLMRKLDARNRVDIAMWAYETGRIKT